MKNNKYKIFNIITISSILLAGLGAVSFANTKNNNGSIELNSKSFANGTVISTVSGKDVIDLAQTYGGVSYDYYNNFNVNEQGLIINNGDEFTGSATIINEVVGNSVSNINGTIDIWGAKADFYLINPNGINVNNGGVIGDVNKVVLSTASSYSLVNNVNNLQADVNLNGNISGISNVYANNINLNSSAKIILPKTLNLTVSNSFNNRGHIEARSINIFSNNANINNFGNLVSAYGRVNINANNINNHGNIVGRYVDLNAADTLNLFGFSTISSGGCVNLEADNINFLEEVSTESEHGTTITTHVGSFLTAGSVNIKANNLDSVLAEIDAEGDVVIDSNKSRFAGGSITARNVNIVNLTNTVFASAETLRVNKKWIETWRTRRYWWFIPIGWDYHSIERNTTDITYDDFDINKKQ